MSHNPVGGTTVTYLGKVSTPQPRILTMGTQSAINPSSVKVSQGLSSVRDRGRKGKY